MAETYEFTRHTLSVPVIKSESNEVKERSILPITRYDIIANGAAFCLQNFLTDEECRGIIQQAESLGLKDCGYSKRIRKTDRVAANSIDLAHMILERLEPFLKPFDLAMVKGPSWYPEGIPSSMAGYKWYPSEVNPTFRICRYKRGGFFLPHHDGGFNKDEYCRSIQTFMIYLNDDFEGGHTNFYTQEQHHYQRPELDNLVHSYTPKTGDALVFNSQITHDGGMLRSGQKYILRSEVMYTANDELVKKSKETILSNASSRPDHDPNAVLNWP